jgi:ribosomal protein S18 acetylase RimI-like enzyme
MLASMRVFFRGISEAAEGAWFLELDGVVAAVNPRVPERSLPNSVIYADEASLERALPELARVYDDAGVLAWTVWVPAHHQRTRQMLAEAGHVQDANSAAMLASLDEVESPRDDDPQPESEPRMEDVGRINDLAYGTGDAFQRMTGTGPADPTWTYVACADGEPASVVVSQDLDGDCSIYCVATLPEARGRGLAAGLMRRALADGRERGCEVSTLQATKLGEPVYERLGYRSFGTIPMWERRRSAA